MSENPPPIVDPLRAWREWFVRVEQQWSQSLTDLMKDERVARTMGKEFEASLHQHQMFAEAIGQYLGALNMPTREDLLKIGERMGKVEDALATLQAEISRLRVALAAGEGADGAVAPRPPRTRKPPAAKE